MAEAPWHVEGVSHLAHVNAYYASGSIHVRQASLHPPLKPFFSDTSVFSGEGEGESNRAKKKRKKLKQQQLQLQELIASGKFVPLGASTIEALTQAHVDVLSSRSWQPGVSSTTSSTGEVACVDPQIVDSDSHANTTDEVAFIRHNDTAYVMPPHASFTIGDVREVLSTKASSALGPFRLIVMDPPWENKSVDRKRCYSTFHHRELLKIDIPSLSMPVCSGDGDDGTVLAIWVTNRPTYMTFILEELLPAWGFAHHATWYWLKVCMSGELVSPLSSTHRLPVEKLVIATRTHNPLARERLCSRLGYTPKVVVSVPLRHSWKPPPECFFPHEVFTGHKLEVFARELRPHFVSVGNEPLKFQSLRLFEPSTASTPGVQCTFKWVHHTAFVDLSGSELSFPVVTEQEERQTSCVQ